MKSSRHILAVAFFLAAFVWLVACNQEKKSDAEVTQDNRPAYAVKILIDFQGNLLLDKYDVEFLVDGSKVGEMKHGKDAEFSLSLKEGTHQLVFQKKGSKSVNGSASLQVNNPLEARYKISCHGSDVTVETIEVYNKVSVTEDEVIYSNTETDFKGKDYKQVVALFIEMGFCNIREIPQYDIVWGFTTSGSVESVQINGSTSFKRGDVFKKDVPIMIVYHMPKDDDPSKDITEAPKPTEPATTKPTKPEPTKPEPTKPEPTKSPTSNNVYYSTNDKNTAKKGNTGVFSYIKEGRSYSSYYIIDFDEGFVYYFMEGNGDATCTKAKMVSGDLNAGLLVIYVDGSVVWQEQMHFSFRNRPDKLIVWDHNNFDYEFKPVDIEKALAIMATKQILNLY